jgi:membrane protease subunit HflC
MQARSMVVTACLFIALVLFSSMLFVVKETERAVVLRFGKLANADVSPGLHVKMPFIDDVRKFEGRILTVDASPENFYTVQKKRLKVDSFAKWRIANVETYYRATGGSDEVASSRLEARINDGLRNKFGTRTLHEVVSGQRDELMHELTDELNRAVNSSLGIEVVDVRVKRIDLPKEVGDSVFNRMEAEREKKAREYRAKGAEQAERIRAEADREKVVIEALAYRDGEILRGEGDAGAAAIYAEAYTKDAEFFAFLRSLEAYRSSFSGKQDMILVKPESEFFRYLKRSSGMPDPDSVVKDSDVQVSGAQLDSVVEEELN